MSKAFTRESDEAPDSPAPPRPFSLLPPGAKNYLTPDGAARLRTELDELLRERSPAPAAEGHDAEARQRRAALDQRITQLEHCLRTATVVPPPGPPWDEVRFGATVMIRERGGREDSFRIVGADEADPARGQISWLSPIASALLNTRIGQRVRLRVPAGEREVEVVSIRYE